MFFPWYDNWLDFRTLYLWFGLSHPSTSSLTVENWPKFSPQDLMVGVHFTTSKISRLRVLWYLLLLSFHLVLFDDQDRFQTDLTIVITLESWMDDYDSTILHKEFFFTGSSFCVIWWSRIVSRTASTYMNLLEFYYGDFNPDSIYVMHSPFWASHALILCVYPFPSITPEV